ncbi:DUF5994 family protein [Actinophytocola gossypii]|uniref:Uncharacterized protein n=1 Tax=Actinophytocola gossypii TaxID=2812003 RepID=A0ABT2J2E6_9PSEU|nr:DUF5994 family protein [Actinophytocola gossypii]MCT2582028.1 hypothetical protein [Actinophytocola gossypii]
MTRREPRLEMKPAGAAPGSVDGGWWPRSLDPTTAFPELATALHPWVGRIGRIAYNRGRWEPAPRKQTLDGLVIRYAGLDAIDPHTVTVIGTSGRRVSLLVVPPHTPGGVARAVLRSAADADSTAAVADILASNGVPLETCVPAETVRPGATESIPEQGREAEGGYARNTARNPAARPGSAR